MSLLRTFAKQFSWLALADVWGKFVMFILYTIVGRIDAGVLGVYAYILAIVGIFSIIGDFGTTSIYIREGKKNIKDRLGLLVQFVFLKVIMVVFFLCAGVIWLLYSHPSVQELHYFFLYSVFIIFDTFTTLFLGHLRIQEQFRYEAGVKIVSKAVLLICLGIALVLGQANLYGVFIAYAITGMIGFCAAGVSFLPEMLKSIARGTYRPSAQMLKMAFVQSFPLGLSSVFWQIYYRIDMLLLKHLKGDVQTGYYAAAYSILQLITTLPTLAMLVLYPKLVETYYVNTQKYRTQFWKISAFGFVSGVVMLIVTEIVAPLLPYYYGQAYQESANLLRILGFAIPALYVNTILTYGLIITKKTISVTYVVLIALAINVSFNLVFIPQSGAYAAAWAMVVTEYSATVCILVALALAHRAVFSSVQTLKHTS